VKPNYTRVGLVLLAIGIVILGLAWLSYAPGAGDITAMSSEGR
jgi:hypothetical protein